MWTLILEVFLLAAKWWFGAVEQKQAALDAFVKFVQQDHKEKSAKLRLSYEQQLARLKEKHVVKPEKTDGEG